MRKFTVGGIIVGWAFYGSDKMGSAFMKGAALVMFCVMCIWFFREMRHATLMAKVGPNITQERKKMYASPVHILIQVLAIMGISFFLGFALGWVLDVAVFR